jgi:hypothetical protein
MSTTNESCGPHGPPSVSEFQMLDETLWQKWLAKGRERDEERRFRYSAAAKWATLGLLLATAGFWIYAEPYQIAIRFAVALGAVSALVQAVHTRHFVFAAIFSALVLLYNPVLLAFPLSGDGARWVVFASMIPFAAAPMWQQPAGAELKAA